MWGGTGAAVGRFGQAGMHQGGVDYLIVYVNFIAVIVRTVSGYRGNA